METTVDPTTKTQTAEQTDQSVKPKDNSFKRFVELCATQKTRLVWACILSVASTVCGLLPFVFIYLIVLQLFQPPLDQGYLWLLAGLVLAAIIAKYGLFNLSTSLAHSAAFRIQYDLRLRLVRYLGGLPLGYFNRTGSGDLKKVIYDDVEQIELMIAHNLPDTTAALAVPLLTLLLMYGVDWRLALAATLILPLAMWPMSKMFGSHSQEALKQYFDLMQSLNSTAIEYIQGMPVIKAFNQTVFSFVRYRSTVEQVTEYNVSHSKRSTFYFGLFLAIIGGPLLLILPVGLWLYLAGNLALSIFIFFLIVGLGYTASLFRLLYSMNSFAVIIESEKRISAILKEPTLVEPAIPAPELASFEVEFREVGFRYQANTVLDGLSFVARAGNVTALVGPSGAGKTTAARLIPRFWDVESGAICIGGQDIRQLPTAQLMDYVSFVFQDVYLFNDTIENNLRMGKPDATQAELEVATRAARCHDFIMALPAGYQTVLGERGATLSGGEKQRLSIARAILKNAPIVVFDEATAFIDPENEGQIQDAISYLTQGKTLIIIAHRLSTITEADRIVVINQGKAIAQGRHQELLATSPLYRSLWEAHIQAQDWQFGNNQAAAMEA
jgi:ATP-binding cassette subfamily B protein